MKILVVDDDPVTMTAIVDLLKMDGHEADHAANALGAYALLPVLVPDVLVMDWRMPAGIDGAALLTTIRRDERWRYLPVLILTAMSRDEAEDEFQRLPVPTQPARFLQKPVTIADVKAELRELAKMTV